MDGPILPDRSLRSRLRVRLRWLLRLPLVDWYDVGDRLTMGRHSYHRPRVRWFYGDDAVVRVGNFSSIAEGAVIVLGGNHPIDWISTFPIRARFGLPGAYEDGSPRSKGDITIGSDVYIGLEARILSGVRIGDGAVIGAYSVIGKNVRPYAVVVGNPAREIRRRFTDDQVERLLRIAWWNWPDEQIVAAVDLLNADDTIEEFLDRYDPPRDGPSKAGELEGSAR